MSDFAAIAVQTWNTLKLQRGQEVVYRRNNQAEIDLVMVPARKTAQINSAHGKLTFTTSDWLILASNLAEDNTEFFPERGERMTSGAFEYEVLPDSSFPHWEYFDSTHQVLRIRTVEVTP